MWVSYISDALYNSDESGVDELAYEGNRRTSPPPVKGFFTHRIWVTDVTHYRCYVTNAALYLPQLHGTNVTSQ